MILRAINYISDIRMSEGEELIRQFVISTERKDSHGTIIKLDGWGLDDFNRAGAFYYQHLTGGGAFSDPDPDNALGPASAVRQGNELIGIGKFEPAEINAKAAKIMSKVDYGTFRSTSVGFQPLQYTWGNERDGEDPKTLYFRKQVLKEFSIVHIPSNPDAIKKSMEPMDNFILKASEMHESEGFKKDIRFEMSRREKANRLYQLAVSRNYI
jgi:hypothetical protein